MRNAPPVPVPTSAYLAATDLPSTRFTSQDVDRGASARATNAGPESPPLIIDTKRILTKKRPYLSTFLSYISSSSTYTNQPTGDRVRRLRFLPIAQSSGTTANTLSALSFLNLVPQGVPAVDGGGYVPSPARGDVLSMVFNPTSAGLSKGGYEKKVENPRDVSRIWQKLGWKGKDRDEIGAKRTIILLDQADEEGIQLHNNLAVYSSPLAQGDNDDLSLLIAIHHLETLRRETNISFSLKNGSLSDAQLDAERYLVEQRLQPGADPEDALELSDSEVYAELARRGQNVCRGLGIEVRREWDARWREKLLRREGRL